MLLRMTMRRFGIILAIVFASLPLWAQQGSGPSLQDRQVSQNPAKTSASPRETTKSKAAASQATGAAKQVSLFAVVRDKHGQPVADLTPRDFALEHDGKANPITQLSRGSDWPLTIGIVSETSPGESKALSAERKAAGAFLKRLLRSGTDRAFVLHFDKQVELLQDVTASQQKLERGIELISAGEWTLASKDSNQARPRFYFGGNTLYDAIFLSADEVLHGWGERRAIVVFSSGVDRQSKVSLARAIQAAQRAGTLVYCVYVPYKGAPPRDKERDIAGGGGSPYPGGGYPRSPLPGTYPGGYPGNYPGGQGPFPGGGLPGPGQEPRDEKPEPVDGRKILRRIARETGGGYFEMKKKKHAKRIFEQIEEQLRHQYRLSFTSRFDASGLHRLKITTPKRKLTVQAPDAFYVE
jgi:VWFA-related protein